MSDVQISPKKIGIWLGLGIFFLPYIFAWFTLRRGYSRNARVIAFGWLVVAMLIMVFDQHALSPSPERQRTAEKEYWRDENIAIAKAAVLKILKDPSSASFRDITVVLPKTFNKDRTGVVCGSVNAKNSFGGYTGYELFMVISGIPLIQNGEYDSSFAKVWNKECANKPAI